MPAGSGERLEYGYDSRGRRLSLTRGNGSVQTYGYDPVSRLLQFKDELAGTSHDRTLGFAYNPAGQIASTTRSNDLFAGPAANVALETPVNGRNRVTRVTEDGASDVTSYDQRGNMTGDGTNDYTYTSQNQLTGRRDPGTTVSNPSLGYDPLGRLYRYTASGVVRRFGYDGDAMIAEYNSANAVQRRYVHGAGVDEPLVQYDGTGTATRRWLHADERGSIVARSDDNGAVDHVNTYDEYGVPGADNIGRFGYTGQVWLPELGLYYYRARMYNPRLGRFMQADPIGYGAGLNLYAYVGGDPVNGRDPSGTCMVVTGSRICLSGDNLLGALGDVGFYMTMDEFRDFESSLSRGGSSHTALTCVARCGSPPAHVNEAGELVVSAPPDYEWVRIVDLPPFWERWPAPTAVQSQPDRAADYCGAGSSAWVPDCVPPVSFRNACVNHDTCYATPGNSKAACDDGLFDDISRDCIDQGGMPYSTCITYGFVYYAGVTVGGGGPDQDAQEFSRSTRLRGRLRRR